MIIIMQFFTQMADVTQNGFQKGNVELQCYDQSENFSATLKLTHTNVSINLLQGTRYYMMELQSIYRTSSTVYTQPQS